MEYPQVGPVDRYEGEEWQENFILLSDLSPYILDCIEVIIAWEWLTGFPILPVDDVSESITCSWMRFFAW
jgi:hypothetical protein